MLIKQPIMTKFGRLSYLKTVFHVPQSVEHEAVGHDDIVRLLDTNLNEEKAADKKLSNVALRKGVNRKAAS
jgi:hypothetical protein